VTRYEVRKRTTQLHKYNSHTQHYIIYNIMMPCKVCDLRNAFRPLIYIYGFGCSVKPAWASNFQFGTWCKKKNKKIKRRGVINKTFPHLKRRKTLTVRLCVGVGIKCLEIVWTKTTTVATTTDGF